MGAATGALSGRHILVVEHDDFLATDTARDLERHGAEIVGPAATVGDALALVEAERLDGAVLDVNLTGETVYPAADGLLACGVPVANATGYDMQM